MHVNVSVSEVYKSESMSVRVHVSDRVSVNDIHCCAHLCSFSVAAPL